MNTFKCKNQGRQENGISRDVSFKQVEIFQRKKILANVLENDDNGDDLNDESGQRNVGKRLHVTNEINEEEKGEQHGDVNLNTILWQL